MKWSKAPKTVRSELRVQGVYGLVVLICTVMMFTGDGGLDPLVLGYGRMAGCIGTLLAVGRILDIVLMECRMQRYPMLREKWDEFCKMKRDIIDAGRDEE